MRNKSLLLKAWGLLVALPLLPSLVFAFQSTTARRASYGGLTPQAHWEELWTEVMWDITIIGGVYILVALVFFFAFKAKSKDGVGASPKLSLQAVIGWVMIPSMLFLGDDLFLYVKAYELHTQMREVPANAQEIKVTASMWNWNYDYGDGVDADNELRVPVGKPVVLRMISEDVIHSHYLDKYHVSEDVMPGRITWEWFMPDKIGKTVITCREYCGPNHSKMFGKLIVLSQKDYDAWMAEELAAVMDKNTSSQQVASITTGAPLSIKAVQ
ncbi:MAG TPA: hypothetical protein ENI62_08265 [Gammaproteobacteria bacterium]|nr:hypothetical protein [Gammaproteobacteria bacterium]